MNLDCKKFLGDIRLSGALIKQCDFIITVDSYYSHVAFALSVPAIVLYSYAPHFAIPPGKNEKIIALEHPIEDCNSISTDIIHSSIKVIS